MSRPPRGHRTHRGSRQNQEHNRNYRRGPQDRDRDDHKGRGDGGKNRQPQEEGLKARHARGFAEQWWAQRWIGTLESFGWSNRLARGKSYARSGQVLDYHVTPGEIVARVQGSRPKPYVVKIAMHTLSNAEWERAIARMAASASYAVRLLTGEMPQNIEDVFTDLGSSLLPAQEWDLKTSCSCPDYANPCKHIAAVHYILGEAFDQDPFLIFQLRGRSKQELLSALRAARGGDLPETESREPEGPLYEPLPVHPSVFWRGDRLPESFDVGFEPPRVPQSVLTRLGSPGPWVQTAEFVAALSPGYSAISHSALKTALDTPEKHRKSRKSEEPAAAAPVPVAAPPVSVAPLSASLQVLEDAPPSAEPVAPLVVPEPAPPPPELAASAEEDVPAVEVAEAAAPPRARTARRRTATTAPTSQALLSVAASRRPEGLSDREMQALQLAQEALITTERYRQATGISAYEAREELFSLQLRGFLQREGQGRWTSWSLTEKGAEALKA